jgi:hypothetical protein
LATTQPVREFISSGEAEQQVSDDGTFRRLFLDVLAGKEPDADANHDGYVTGTELGLFLHQKITNLTNNRQTPRYGKLNAVGYDRGDFVFQVAASQAAPPRPADTATASEPKNSASEAAQAWAATLTTTSVAVLEEFIRQFGNTPYGSLARARLEELKKNQTANIPPVALQPPATQPATQPAQQGWLGVRIQEVTDAIADGLDLRPARGALVAFVDPRSPAVPAGIQSGDVIVRFDGKDIKEMRDLPRVVAETPAGKPVDIVIVRKGREEKRTITLGRLDSGDKPAATSRANDTQSTARQDCDRLTKFSSEQLFAGGDAAKAIVACRQALDLLPNDSNVIYSLAGAYHVNRNVNDALRLYRQAAEMGNADALNRLGEIYRNGRIVRQDFQEAARLFRKAADLGNANAKENLTSLTVGQRGRR